MMGLVERQNRLYGEQDGYFIEMGGVVEHLVDIYDPVDRIVVDRETVRCLPDLSRELRKIAGLPDQLCHAGLARCEGPKGEDLLVLSNVPGPKREGLVLSVSRDQGMTWNRARLLEKGPAAYSTLDVLPDGSLLCVWETGEGTSRQHLAAARVEVPWLLAGTEGD